MKSSNVLLGIAGGLLAGVVLGVLFAPDKGANTRKKIIDKGNDLKDKLKSQVNDLADKVSPKVQSIVDDSQEIFEQNL